jgi:hypothetical protein
LERTQAVRWGRAFSDLAQGCIGAGGAQAFQDRDRVPLIWGVRLDCVGLFPIREIGPVSPNREQLDWMVFPINPGQLPDVAADRARNPTIAMFLNCP